MIEPRLVFFFAVAVVGSIYLLPQLLLAQESTRSIPLSIDIVKRETMESRNPRFFLEAQSSISGLKVAIFPWYSDNIFDTLYAAERALSSAGLSVGDVGEKRVFRIGWKTYCVVPKHSRSALVHLAAWFTGLLLVAVVGFFV